MPGAAVLYGGKKAWAPLMLQVGDGIFSLLLGVRKERIFVPCFGLLADYLSIASAGESFSR